MHKFLKTKIANYTAIGPFSNIKGLTYYRDNEEDPYITLKDVGRQYMSFLTLLTEQSKEDDDEREELEVLPTDNLIVVAKTEDEISQLEICVCGGLQEFYLPAAKFSPSRRMAQLPSRVHALEFDLETIPPPVPVVLKPGSGC